MPQIYVNNNMTVRLVGMMFPYSGGSNFRLALVKLCDGQCFPWVVCRNLETATDMDGRDLCQWGSGKYFSTQEEASKIFAKDALTS